MTLTDCHCHLANARYPGEDIPALLERAQRAGVHRIVTLATSLNNVERTLALAENPAVHASLGIHPCDVHLEPDDAIFKLASYMGDGRVCGIGETGLDYFHPSPSGWSDEDFRQRQRGFLEQHFQLAEKCRLNIVIHTRDLSGAASFEDALAIYRQYHKSVRAMFHCFVSTWENAHRVFELGGIVSFGGVATFKSAHQVKETMVKCPAGTFVLETDAPYLAPEPHRGERNEPAYIRKIAECFCLLRGETMEHLTAHTEATANAFFRFEK